MSLWNFILDHAHSSLKWEGLKTSLRRAANCTLKLSGAKPRIQAQVSCHTGLILHRPCFMSNNLKGFLYVSNVFIGRTFNTCMNGRGV